MRLYFMLFASEFHEAPTIFGWKMIQTLYKRTLCVYSPMLSINKLTYFTVNEKR